jgi:DNA-binding SARP family transcriptional activator
MVFSLERAQSASNTVQSKQSVNTTSLKLVLLGRAHFERENQRVRIPTRKGIGLLAYLALEGVQSRARLAMVFWGQFDETRGRMNLRRELQRIRDLGLEEALLVTSSSVQLATEVWCDAKEFQNAIRKADVATAVHLWGGVLLEGVDAEDDLEFDIWLERNRADFQAQYLDSLHSFAALLENAREYRQALGAYQQILAEDNLNESVYRALIRIYGLLGMREQAQVTFSQLEVLLREDLGLTPLPETLLLIEQIRANLKPQENLNAKNDTNLFEPPFVGREDVIAEFKLHPSRIQVILGEPGVGKSRLAAEFLAQSGVFVKIQGREDWRGITLAPITAVLREHQHKLESLSSSDRLELARLIPELEPNSKNLEAPSLEGRTRFLQALANALEISVQGGAMLVDDIHWLDESSVNVLTLLLNQSSIQAIFTAREAELESADHVRISINTLERQGILKKIQLQALSEIDVLELVRVLSGASGAIEFSERLFDATAGNPFFTLETIRHLFATGFLEVSDGLWQVGEQHANYQELPIPNTLKTMILERIMRLGAGVQRLLEAASLNGALFELSDLEGATALGEWDALDALEQSVGAQLIRLQETGYRFTHDLVRRTLEDAILPERKSRIHDKLANNAILKNALPERIAEHFEAAGKQNQAVQFRYLAAERLEKLNLSQAAKEQLELAFKLISTKVSNDEQRLWLVKIHLKLGNVKHDLADYQAARFEFEHALEIAKLIANPGLQSECLSGLARVAGGLSSYASVLKTCQESLELARQSHDPIITARALYWLGNTEFQLGNTKLATKHLIESLELQQLSSELDMIATTNILLGRVATFDKDHARAIEYYRIALESNRKIGYLKGTALCLTGISWRALLVKDFEIAEQTARESLELYLRLGGPWLIANAMTNLAHALAGKNMLEAAKHHYANALERSLEIEAFNITLEILVGVAQMLLSENQSLAARLLATAIQHERSTAEIRDYAAPVVLEWQKLNKKNAKLPLEHDFQNILTQARSILHLKPTST